MDNWSMRKPKLTSNLSIEIQSNKLTTIGSWPAFPNKYKVTAKETATESVPQFPRCFYPLFLPRKTLNKNPKKGANSKTKTKLVSIEDYPFKFFKFPTSIVSNVPEYRNQNSQSYRHFRSSNSHGEKHENLSLRILVISRKSHEQKIDRIQHYFD